VSILRPVAAAQRLHEPDNLAAFLEARFDEREINQMR